MFFDNVRNTLVDKTRKAIRPVLKNTKTASYFTITLSLFSLSFFGLFAIRPTLITAVSLVKEVSDLKQLSLDYENKISSFITAQSEYEKIRDSIPLVDSALPQYSNFPGVVKMIEQIALRNEIAVNQLQIDSAPISIMGVSDEINNFNFIMIGIGRYERIHRAIADLSNSLRLTTLNSLDFSVEAGTVSGLLRVAIKGKTYYEP